MSLKPSSSNQPDIAENISLQDTYKSLKIIEKEMLSEIDRLTDIRRNNPSSSLNKNTPYDDILNKQQQFLEGMKELALQENPKNYPSPKTKDMHATAVQSLGNEVGNMKSVLDEMERKVTSLKNEVSYLENKIAGYKKMKEAALNSTENAVNNTYERELNLSKSIFSSVKKDLKSVLNLIFPKNNQVASFMLDLSKKQLSGGDDVYLDLTEETFLYANVLVAMGIIAYHPNNKKKCKMVNFL